MGKLILCSGVLAKQPFHFSLTDTYVYSIEELCYYLYHNIYIVTEDTFDEHLVAWLREQVCLETMSQKLSQMIENQNSMKDMIVSILCSADYYTESEIKELIMVMDEINHRTPKEKQKIKANNYLKFHNYSKAAMEYEKLLQGDFGDGLSTEEYGDILHNLATIYIHTSSYMEAAKVFKEAYSRNHRDETLQQYLHALKLTKNEKKYKSELESLGDMGQLEETIDQIYSQTWEDAEQSSDYLVMERLPAKKSEGHVGEYYRVIDEYIVAWEQKFKNEVR